MAIEIEAKMKVEDFDPVRRRLIEVGARRVGSVLETNAFFDTPDESLVRQDRGLRLRTMRDDSDGRERFLITVKGPQRSGPLKSREESEMSTDSGPRAVAVLEALGYRRCLTFEKRRESWELDRCHIELDELPILGRFVEIEGPDESTVMRTRKTLGMSNLEPIRTGYSTMLAEHFRRRGVACGEVRF